MSSELAVYEGQQLKVMIEVANAFPRKLDTFVDDVYKEVTKDVEQNRDFALSCIYCVPVGKDPNTGVQKFHSDPSVRITEIMQKYWKHLRVIVNGTIDGGEIVVNGLIVDCQANNAETLIDRVNCSGWSERRKSLKLKAMQSTMKRDLRLSIMGKGYANQLKNRIFTGLFPDISEGWKMAVSAFGTIGIDEKTLFGYFKISNSNEITREMLFNALGIYNFLKETGDDPKSVFGRESKKPSVTEDDIIITERQGKANKAGSKGKGNKEPIKNESGQNKPKNGSEEVPEVMDQEEFSNTVFSLALQAGIKVEDGLKECLDVDHIDDVLPELQSKVIDFFTDKSEQAGA